MNKKIIILICFLINDSYSENILEQSHLIELIRKFNKENSLASSENENNSDADKQQNKVKLVDTKREQMSPVVARETISSDEKKIPEEKTNSLIESPSNDSSSRPQQENCLSSSENKKLLCIPEASHQKIQPTIVLPNFEEKTARELKEMGVFIGVLATIYFIYLVLSHIP